MMIKTIRWMALSLGVFCSNFLFAADTWNTAAGIPNATGSTPVVCYDAFRQIAVAVWEDTGTIYSSVFDATTLTWEATPTVLGPGKKVNLALMRNNYSLPQSVAAIAVWINGTDLMYSVYNNTTNPAWTTASIVPGTSGASTQSTPQIGISREGKSLLVYETNGSPTLVVATETGVFPNNPMPPSAWPVWSNSLTTLSSNGVNSSMPSLSLNTNTINGFVALAVWDENQQEVHGNYYLFGGGWNASVLLSDATVKSLTPVACISMNNQWGFAAWTTIVAGSLTNIATVAFNSNETGGWQPTARTVLTNPNASAFLAAGFTATSPLASPTPVLIVTDNNSSSPTFKRVQIYNGTFATSPASITWSNAPALTSSSNSISPGISFTNEGTAMAYWTDSSSQFQGTGFYNGSSWTELDISASGAGIGSIFADIDPFLGLTKAISVFPTSGLQYALFNFAAGPTPPPPPPPPGSLLPPENLKGKQSTNSLPFQKEFVNNLSWGASPSAGVVSYNIYRDGDRIGSVSASGSLSYSDYDFSWKQSYTYSVTAVDFTQAESMPVNVFIK